MQKHSLLSFQRSVALSKSAAPIQMYLKKTKRIEFPIQSSNDLDGKFSMVEFLSGKNNNQQK